jgi:hypothetical protein
VKDSNSVHTKDVRVVSDVGRYSLGNLCPYMVIACCRIDDSLLSLFDFYSLLQLSSKNFKIVMLFDF